MVKNMLIHFFGQGTEPEFALFTLAHFMPILLLFAALYLLYKYKDNLRASKYETNFRYILGFMMILYLLSGTFL